MIFSDNMATKGTGAAFSRADKLEGKFERKAPDVQERKDIETPFAFESIITASIIQFHKISEGRTYFIVRGEPSIQELVFEDTPASYMESGNRDQPSANPDLRWIHLPANNMSWIQVGALHCGFW
jgi:hypothetical protein